MSGSGDWHWSPPIYRRPAVLAPGDRHWSPPTPRRPGSLKHPSGPQSWLRGIGTGAPLHPRGAAQQPVPDPTPGYPLPPRPRIPPAAAPAPSPLGGAPAPAGSVTKRGRGGAGRRSAAAAAANGVPGSSATGVPRWVGSVGRGTTTTTGVVPRRDGTRREGWAEPGGAERGNARGPAGGRGVRAPLALRAARLQPLP